MRIEPTFLRRIAAVAAAETLPRFRRQAVVDNKADGGFDPVTEADRAAERAIRSAIRERFPDHGILGEEDGGERLERDHIWVIDPIDGTRAFISGLPVWGTLVGLTVGGRAVAGLMSQPFTGELFYSDGEAACYEGPGGGRLLKTRAVADISGATLFTTTPALFADAKRAAYERLERRVKLARYGVDCYAFAMVAAGFVDVVVEAQLQPYDIVALIPIIAQAGGIVTRWDGGPAEEGGDIIAAGSPALHAAALEIINSA